VGCSPTPQQHFCKIAAPKNFFVACGLFFETMLLGKTIAYRVANVFKKQIFLRENGLSHPAKGGSTPAFACQRAAIAPLPFSNLQP